MTTFVICQGRGSLSSLLRCIRSAVGRWKSAARTLMRRSDLGFTGIRPCDTVRDGGSGSGTQLRAGLHVWSRQVPAVCISLARRAAHMRTRRPDNSADEEIVDEL